MKRTVTALTVALMMLATIVGPAMAVVVYDADDQHTWDWQVGKGDVQSAFGWSAKQTDARFDDVTYTHKRIVTTEYSCVDTASGQYTTVVGTRTDVSSTTKSSQSETRKNKSSVVTGAFVTKAAQLGSEVREGECPSGYARSSLKTKSTTHELSAWYQGQERVIWTSVTDEEEG
jgi:hypothetical protein